MAGRDEAVRRGRILEYFTLAYNVAEGGISVIAGLIAGSVSLVGFGLDSAIEVGSGAALLWRLRHDADPERRERVEALSLRIVGWCFLALATYVTYEAVESLARRDAPDRSMIGIVIAALSVVIMPVLARAKRDVARTLGSGAMRADSRQTDFCAYLSAILLGGLLLNATLGWWWADPVAALVMAPIIAKEGWDSVRGKACCDHCGCAR